MKKRVKKIRRMMKAVMTKRWRAKKVKKSMTARVKRRKEIL
jgi:hypothetical protein